MSLRTIIEINHDYLAEANNVIADLIEALPYASAGEIRDELAKSNAVRFIAQRHHSNKVTLEVG